VLVWRTSWGGENSERQPEQRRFTSLCSSKAVTGRLRLVLIRRVISEIMTVARKKKKKGFSNTLQYEHHQRKDKDPLLGTFVASGGDRRRQLCALSNSVEGRGRQRA